MGDPRVKFQEVRARMAQGERFIFIHHSASDWGTALEIDRWHRENRGWKMIGYSFVVLNGYPTAEDFQHGRYSAVLDGSIECGRPLDLDSEIEEDEVGAHVYGLNRNSIGICAVHKTLPYSIRQIFGLITITREVMRILNVPVYNVLGHCEVDPHKPLCPGLDMWWFRNMLISWR